jgi:hypothetical protein
MDMFERATREKFRFETRTGLVSVEDLWDLPLTSHVGKPNLDDVARSLHKKLKSGDDVSFVETNRKSDDLTQAKFDLVRSIIETRLQENKEASEARGKSDRKQRLLALLAEKEDEGLRSKSADELRKMVEEI